MLMRNLPKEEKAIYDEPYFGWGEQICPPPPKQIFSNNSVRKNFIAMKLLDYLQLLIVQLLKKFH